MFESFKLPFALKKNQGKLRSFRSSLSLGLEKLEYRDQPGSILTGLFDQIGISAASILMDSLNQYSLGITSGESIAVNQETTQIDAYIAGSTQPDFQTGPVGALNLASEIAPENNSAPAQQGNTDLGSPSNSGLVDSSDYMAFMANGDANFNSNMGPVTPTSNEEVTGSAVSPIFDGNALVQDYSETGFVDPTLAAANGGSSSFSSDPTPLGNNDSLMVNGSSETLVGMPVLDDMVGSGVLVAGPDLLNLDAVGAVAPLDQVILPGMNAEVIGPVEGFGADPVVANPANPVQNQPVNQPVLNGNDPVLAPGGGWMVDPGLVGLGGFLGGVNENYNSGFVGTPGFPGGVIPNSGIGEITLVSSTAADGLGGPVTGTINISAEGGLAGNVAGGAIGVVDGGVVLTPEDGVIATATPVAANGAISTGDTTSIGNISVATVLRGTGITLVTPEFVRRGESDVVEVQLSQAIVSAGGTGFIDRDVNLDGDFNDTDEAGVQSFAIASESVLVDFGAEASEGLYRLRARVEAAASKTEDMTIDWHSGYIGDQSLLGIANGLISQESQVRGGALNSVDSGVLVQARCTLPKYLDQFQKDLKELGMVIQNVSKSQNLVTGTLAQNKILELENIPNFLTAVDAPLVITKVGSVTSEGVAPMLVPSFISQTGADGTGVIVGVISDSASAASVAASQSTGDLPAVVNVLSAGAGSDEGTAMLEIVYDVAPGAGLAFSTSGGTAQNFAASITGLAAAGSRVIVDDIGIANTPFFNDGIVSQAVDTVAAQGVFYASAAGNDGSMAYRGAFTNTNATVAGITGTFQDFGGGDFIQDLNMATGDLLRIICQWNTAYLEGGSALPNYQVTNDFSVLVIDTSAGTVLQTFNNDNLATDEAYEPVGYVVTNVTTLGLAFQLNTGPAPTQLAWISFAASNPNAQGQGATTIFGQPEANGAVCVGAVNYANLSAPETFTALGGALEIFYDIQGNPLSTPEIRQKPEIAGPDGVSTTVPGFSPFFGTSAAAPHVAGVAALMFSQQPNATVQEVIDHLYATAIPVGANNPDLVGVGFIQALPLQISGGGNGANTGTIGNNTADTALRLGALGAQQTLSNQVIEFSPQGFPLFDWFQWKASKSGTFTATLSISTSEPLEMNVYYKIGNGLTRVGNTSGIGNLTLSLPILAGQEVFVEVKGFNVALGVITTGRYSLTTNIS